MIVNTKAYGSIEVDERQRIQFPKGLFGFEDMHDFVLLDSTQEPFYWLQSTEERDLAFVLINPAVFRPDFSIKTSPEEMDGLEIEEVTDETALVFAIVTIPEDKNKMSANLQGPIIISKKNHTGRQVISLDSRWKVRHYILEEMVGSSSC